MLALNTTAVAWVIFVVVLVGWITYYFLNSASARKELGSEIEMAPNRKPYYDDEVLEGRRLERVQLLGVLVLATMVIGLPVYWILEPGRQAGAVDRHLHAVGDHQCQRSCLVESHRRQQKCDCLAEYHRAFFGIGLRFNVWICNPLQFGDFQLVFRKIQQRATQRLCRCDSFGVCVNDAPLLSERANDSNANSFGDRIRNLQRFYERVGAQHIELLHNYLE